MKKTICSLCGCNCGIKVKIEDNKILEVSGDKDHPVTKGFICPKGKALPSIINADDRIKKPLLKKDNEWIEIDYKEALDIIVDKLKKLKEEYGPEALSLHTGEAGVRRQFPEYAKRFCQVYGTPNYSAAGSHCHLSKTMANKITQGFLPKADYRNSKCIVLWGYNPTNAHPEEMLAINESLRNGGKLIVVDPQETVLAKRADIHFKLRPGSDGALALGLIHIIIKENLFDKEFVENWTLGFDKLIDLVEDYDPLRVESITGVPKDLIIEGARLYANNNPSNISPGIAIELLSNGFQTARAISILQAIMGNIDIKGGGMANLPAPLLQLKIDNMEAEKEAIGRKDFPLFYKTYGVAQANILSDAIIEEKPYPIKAMIVIGSNPLLTWPNTNKLRKAMKSLDFLVVMDNFMTETASLADLIIPGSIFLERNEIWNKVGLSGESIIGVSAKIIDGPGIVEWDFISDLAKALGYEEYFPWKTEEEAIEYRLQKLGLTFEDMKNMDYGFVFGDFKENKYLKAGFRTPSKKLEIYSNTLEEYGYDPLPKYIEPSENPFSDKDFAREYPYTLTSGARYLEYYHSRYRNIEPLREYKDNFEPKARIHSDLAQELEIAEGEIIYIESKRGRIAIKVELTKEILPTTIVLPHGWDQANANELTDNKVLDPISGFPSDRALQVKISKLQ